MLSTTLSCCLCLITSRYHTHTKMHRLSPSLHSFSSSWSNVMLSKTENIHVPAFFIQHPKVFLCGPAFTFFMKCIILHSSHQTCKCIHSFAPSHCNIIHKKNFIPSNVSDLNPLITSHPFVLSICLCRYNIPSTPWVAGRLCVAS